MVASSPNGSYCAANPRACARMRDSLLAAVGPLRDSSERIRTAVARRGWEPASEDMGRVVHLTGEIARRIDAQLAPGAPANGYPADGEGFCRRLRHDLRNPIGAITGYLELSLDEARERADEDLAFAIDRLLDEATALLDLIDSVVQPA